MSVSTGKVEIPYLLLEAVKSGRVIVFLGAGASKECRNLAGKSPPNADQLRDILSTKYFGKAMPKRNVMSVAEMAIDNGAGQGLVFETVNNAFEGFEISEAHLTLTDFNCELLQRLTTTLLSSELTAIHDAVSKPLYRS
jgi:hypothetical protein